MKYLNYDIIKYKFREQLEDILKEFDTTLEQAHKLVNYSELVTLDNEQDTLYHRKFYSVFREHSINDVYRSFIKNVIKPLFDDKELVYLTVPSFRTHFPDNIAVGIWHRDREYGQCVQWNGTNLHHGDKVNKTGKTRFSMDFRAMLYSKYDALERVSKKSIHTGMALVIGEYYDKI